MRVISGSAKGRRLYTPGRLNIRPTSDKVKESLFNVLGQRVYESNFLDLCAGSGAVGIEALSRGAREVSFVDYSRESLELVKKNISLCGFDSSGIPKVNLISLEGARAIDKFAIDGISFDFVFVDTPYHGDILDIILAKICLYPLIVAEDGMLIVEHYSKRDVPDNVGSLTLDRSKRYGDTTLSYYLSKN